MLQLSTIDKDKGKTQTSIFLYGKEPFLKLYTNKYSRLQVAIVHDKFFNFF